MKVFHQATGRQFVIANVYNILAGVLLLSVLAAANSRAATVGTVVPIIGEPRGLAYDPARKLLFIANTTQNRVEVFSTEQMQLLAPIAVGEKPVTMAMVPNSTLLLVCNTESNFLTIVDRETLGTQGTIQVTARAPQTPERPFSVAALSGSIALLSTNAGLQTIDIVARTTQPLSNLGFTAAPNSNLVASGDHKFILGQGGTTAFLYTDQGFVQTRAAAGSSLLAADGAGSRFLIGPTQFDNALFQTAQLFPDGSNNQIPTLSGSAYSSSGMQVFLGINQGQGAQIQVRSAASLKRESAFLIAEPLISGGMLASPAGDFLFALTQSGLTIVDLAAVAQAPSLGISTELLLFKAQICSLAPITGSFQITNSGSQVFSWTATTNLSNVTLEPSSGTGPATVQVTLDPASQSFRGTGILGTISITSPESISGDQRVFLLLNITSPDQIGTVHPVEGVLSDILMDDARQRVYLVNTSKNQIETFSVGQNAFLPPAPVASMPKSMAFIPDKSRLLVTHYGSEYISVLDAETLGMVTRIPIPHSSNPAERFGTLPFAIAAEGGGSFLLAAAPAAPATTGRIYRVDAGTSTVTAFPALGSGNNSTSSVTFLAASGNGAFILVAQAGGTVHLYDTASGNFAITRSLGSAIAGNVAASADGSWYYAGTQVLSSVLVSQGGIPTDIGGNFSELGFLFGLSGAQGYRGIRPANQQSGLPSIIPSRIEKVSTDTLTVISDFNIADAPSTNLTAPQFRILRHMAVNQTESVLYVIGAFGLVVIPLPGQGPVSGPQISAGGIVNGASFALAPAPVAPGSIASIFGTHLAAGTTNANSLPLPNVLGGVCVTMEGFVAPLFSTSPLQLNVQVPWQLAGRPSARAVVSAEGKASPPVSVNLASSAPGIFTFSSNGVGPGAILHSDFSPVSISNPARIGETVLIYATGLGPVTPPIGTGLPAPNDGTQHRTSTPTVTIGGVPATVSFSGLAPGFVGLYQVNARIPSNAPVGTSVEITVRLGTNTSNAATLAIVPATQ